MGRITMELLRKRSEHNEGEIHSMEELALHQEKLVKIELIDKVCRDLKILLLQNNAISKIENVSRLRSLEYINLALNTVEKIEGLEGCEALKKLDLTLNFVAELTSINSLKGLSNLEQLFLVGNPCHDYTGYRDYVVGTLPQLKCLDGRDITKTERIKAMQQHETLERLIITQQQKLPQNPEPTPPITAPTETKDVETVGETVVDCKDDEEDDAEFWKKMTENTPEVRKEMIRRQEREDEKKKPKNTKKVKVPRKLVTAEGRPLNINEAKLSFSLHDEFERSQLVLDLAVPKHLCTTLIDADVQPSHVKVTMKGKIFQLVLPEEVKPDSSFAQRSQVTGHLLITLPKVYDTSSVVWHGKESKQLIDLTSNNNNSAGDSNKGRAGASKHSNPLVGTTTMQKVSPKDDPVKTGSKKNPKSLSGNLGKRKNAIPSTLDDELPPPLMY